MKILQVINQLEGGGAERLVRQLHDRFLKRNHAVLTLALRGAAPESPGFHSLGLNRFSSPLTWMNFRKQLTKVLDENQFSPDVVHSHLTQSQFLTPRLFPRERKAPVWFTTEHDTENKRRRHWLGKAFDKKLYSRYAAIIAISDAVADSLTAWLPSLRGKVLTIPNGIDLQEWEPCGRKFDGTLRIVSVGRLVRKKNMDGLLKAVAELDVPWVLTIAGAGDEETNLRTLARDNGFESRVEFVGHVADVRSLYAAADVAVLFSRYEGFGLAAVESMASGIPTIVSDVPGLREVAGSGLPKVNPNDPIELARELERVAADADYRKNLAEEGLERSKNFDIGKMADAYLQIYQQHEQR